MRYNLFFLHFDVQFSLFEIKEVNVYVDDDYYDLFRRYS